MAVNPKYIAGSFAGFGLVLRWGFFQLQEKARQRFFLAVMECQRRPFHRS